MVEATDEAIRAAIAENTRRKVVGQVSGYGHWSKLSTETLVAILDLVKADEKENGRETLK